MQLDAVLIEPTKHSKSYTNLLNNVGLRDLVMMDAATPCGVLPTPEGRGERKERSPVFEQITAAAGLGRLQVFEDIPESLSDSIASLED